MEIYSICDEQKYNEFRNNSEDKKIALFGSHEDLKKAFSQYLFDRTISFIIDSEESFSNKFMNLEKIHINSLVKETLDDVIILICGNFISVIINKLKAIGCEKVYITKSIGTHVGFLLHDDEALMKIRSILCDEKSIHVFNSIINKRIDDNDDYSDICEDNCYFNEIFENSISEEETYLDLGTLNIDTISSFIYYVKNKYKKIHAFEPTANNYNIIKRALLHNPKINVHPYAVSDTNGEINFFNNPIAAGNSILINTPHSTSVIVKTIALDEFIDDEVTFIKMDIEGAEIMAINGAQHLIKKYKPKLAISLYHKPFDLLEIPLIIHTLVPEYKLFIRHHNNNYWETVLYAYV